MGEEQGYAVVSLSQHINNIGKKQREEVEGISEVGEVKREEVEGRGGGKRWRGAVKRKRWRGEVKRERWRGEVR